MVVGGSVRSLLCLREGLGGRLLPKTAPYGTSLWRFCSAIHGSANFWEEPPAKAFRLCAIVRPLYPAGISAQSQLQTECICETPVRPLFKGLLLRCQEGSVWGPFPKMSEAMDGRREAHMDVLVAVFGKGPQTLLTSQPRRLGPKRGAPCQSQNLTAKLANKNLVEQLGVALAPGSLHQWPHEAAEHLLALLRIFLVLVLSHLIRHAGQNLVHHGLQGAGVRHLLQALGLDDGIYIVVLASP